MGRKPGSSIRRTAAKWWWPAARFCRVMAAERVRAILEISRDITAQLQAEEALRKAEKLAAMGRVAGIIAHEINNPLEAIRNAFYLLQHHPSLDDNARKYTRIADEELTRVAHITRQTLSFYRESKEAVPVFHLGDPQRHTLASVASFGTQRDCPRESVQQRRPGSRVPGRIKASISQPYWQCNPGYA